MQHGLRLLRCDEVETLEKKPDQPVPLQGAAYRTPAKIGPMEVEKTGQMRMAEGAEGVFAHEQLFA